MKKIIYYHYTLHRTECQTKIGLLIDFPSREESDNLVRGTRLPLNPEIEMPLCFKPPWIYGIISIAMCQTVCRYVDRPVIHR